MFLHTKQAHLSFFTYIIFSQMPPHLFRLICCVRSKDMTQNVYFILRKYCNKKIVLLTLILNTETHTHTHTYINMNTTQS
jgi:hypothetical protein